MIHPSAQIAQGAKIADNVQIGPFCRVAEDVILQSGVILEPHVTLENGVTIGAHSHLYAFVHIGNSKATVTIGEACTIREFTKIGTLSTDDQPIVVSADCYIMGYVEIRSGTEVQKGCIITNNVLLGRNSQCQEGVIIGAKATIAKNCTLGRGVMVGGASAVQGDIPPYCLAEGYPHATIRGLNLIGMRRNFKDRGSITQVKKSFMYLKKKGFSPLEASQMLPEAKDTHAKRFIAFIAAHKV